MRATPDEPLTWHWRAKALKGGPAVVFDIDGVLADASGRQHYLSGYRRDWDAFFEAARADPLIPEVARLLEVIDPLLAVVLLTARPASIRADTVGWLERFGLRYDLLVMRAGGDFLRAVEFKRRETRALKEHGFELRLALEDDRRNLEMFEEEGVPCLYVHSGYYG
ncbi:MAG: phosphatase domain-containing protein [Acidimicrobiales bacterium]